MQLALDCQITMDNRNDLLSAGAQITLKHKVMKLSMFFFFIFIIFDLQGYIYACKLVY